MRFTGQHFTIDKVLINDAIGHAEIEENDNVLDIGAGKGFLTIPLVRRCNNVIAIENDSDLIKKLRQKFYKNPKVKIVNVDFRSFNFPNNSFKVVSNIPFGITSDILRLLMYDNLKCFMGGSLIMSSDSIQKLFSEKVFNPYIIFYHTFYDLKIICEISPDSFIPPPGVKSALLGGLTFNIKSFFMSDLLAFLSSKINFEIFHLQIMSQTTLVTLNYEIIKNRLSRSNVEDFLLIWLPP